MEPATKKRRLAPKVEAQPQPVFAHEPAPPAQHYPVQDAVSAPPASERHEFESFARHLQDAAMLIYRQTQRSPYSSVSVLLLRWEDDDHVEQDLVALEQVLRERYNYRTDRWSIPTVPNPSIKLGVRTASFLENAASDHLLIVYYAGCGYVDSDGQVFWASNTKEDAAKLKWNGFRCLFDEAPSDMLLLLDTCATRDAPIACAGSSVKQVLAANGPETGSRETGGRSFTAHLTDAFTRLDVGRPFTAENLYHEIVAQRHHELAQSSGLTNGATKSMPFTNKLPVLYTLSTGTGQSLSLSPLPPGPANGASPLAEGDVQQTRAAWQDQIIHPNAVADLTFEEPRVLVCTTFVGEASPDMSSFNQWLHNTPAMASKIAVEGMFLGPPTMLLISMPSSVWAVVQHDKVCCFLGYINSHNMTHLYSRLVGSTTRPKASAVDVEDGRILLEVRQAAATTPIIKRHELPHRDPNHVPNLPETPVRSDVVGRAEPASLPQSSVSVGLPFANLTPRTDAAKPDDVEESAEMQEAAEQLKALSHVRHMSDEVATTTATRGQSLVDNPDAKRDDASSHEEDESGVDGTHNNAELNTPSAKAKPRRSLQKATPKQETRCNLCSHAPFKDSSSLRKHIAAAHTRPFPCAFAFAGCSSTFGSKNEWKRHIASQHLCLQYYRCSSCSQSTVEGKGNEFNRKDLFTQHLRRMHAPFAIKKAIAKGDSKLQVEWETHVKEMQTSCLVTRRQPPQRSACPKPDCASVFEGPTSWDEWTEHVGRHMEKGEANRLGVDRLLAKWALDEGIIERKEDGEYRLCTGTGTSAEKDTGGNNSAGNYSDGNGRDQPDEERTIVAASTVIPDKMDVDG
ncbi:uncharacterized protein BCR38DRAFT_490230 [Pseudomassariella vexata]|uniref:C2H2-type domain-containing protein n=1 Tax=Pseudomassariella vexata TaxID=1141098 RepID=A0A1Y2DDA8_9PEZI|nr:uncharacterized protein BCR38DRAFT_490230 [Pseudomassariella vexata]ORY57261.1 hypothetical protein BCR38DRAFT_490230 [Pseudomassariella vexata]